MDEGGAGSTGNVIHIELVTIKVSLFDSVLIFIGVPKSF